MHVALVTSTLTGRIFLSAITFFFRGGLTGANTGRIRLDKRGRDLVELSKSGKIESEKGRKEGEIGMTCRFSALPK